MLCFICKKSFTALKILIFHFKRNHDLTSNSSYRCCNINCDQVFQNLNSFRKHVNRKHINSNLNIEINDNKNDVTPSGDNFKKYIITNENLNRAEPDNLPRPSTSNNCLDHCRSNYPEELQFESDKDIKKTLAMFFLEFILSLHNNNNFSRKDVHEVQNAANRLLIEPIFNLFKEFATIHLKEVDTKVYNEFCDFITILKQSIKVFETEHLLHKWLKSEGYIQTIEEFTVNNQVVAKHRVGGLTYEEKNNRGALMPLKFQFTKFFQKDRLVERTLQHIKKLENSKTELSNFVQGSLWKEKVSLYPKKNLIPYLLYSDDMEINNPLGSHSGSHSICNIYYSFPCLPLIKESKLDNIFYAAVIKSADVKLYGNEKCFRRLVQEIKNLEVDGLEFENNLHVHFIMVLVIGDNLGLNSILGFSKSFSSNFFCRLCISRKNDTQKLSVENPNLLRNITNYRPDVATDSPEFTGIITCSLLNEIPSFHVTKNFYVDIMHDIFEGVCHYDLCNSILYFIEKMKFFKLSDLNSRKKLFDYGPAEIGNISGEIEISHLMKKKLKMSAREMMTFVEYLPLMIGDFIPADDIVWNFVINLIEIIDILLCFQINESSILLLQYKIQEHNSNYVILFNDTLKPKMHNLIHYPSIIRQSGPLRNLWCFKFESKHRQFKIYSHIIASRKNICLTLAKKYALKFAYFILTGESIKFDINFNNKFEIESNYAPIMVNKLKTDKKIKYYSSITFNGNEYTCGKHIAIFKDDIYFFVIQSICLVENLNIMLLCQVLEKTNYLRHYNAYEVDLKALGEFSIISLNEIVGPALSVTQTARGKIMIRLKEYFKIIS